MAQRRLENLQLFLLASRIGSLSEAAKLLGISQPTASAHLRALEAELGFPLFDRTPSGVRATPRAQALAREIAPHLDALDDIAHALSPLGAGEPLHLGSASDFGAELLAPRLSELSTAAGVDLRFRFGLAEELLTELRAGALDLVVSSVPPRVHGIAAAPWYDEEFVLVAAPAWLPLLADGSPESLPAALAEIPVISFGPELPIIRRYWRSVFSRPPSGLVVRAIIPELRGIRAALRAGSGMSVLPRYLVEEDLARGALVLLHEPELAPLNTLYLAVRDGDLERRPSLRALVEAVRRSVPN